MPLLVGQALAHAVQQRLGAGVRLDLEGCAERLLRLAIAVLAHQRVAEHLEGVEATRGQAQRRAGRGLGARPVALLEQQLAEREPRR